MLQIYKSTFKKTIFFTIDNATLLFLIRNIFQNQHHIESNWDKTFGDCMNEIVFIVQNLNQEQIKMDLDSCILSDVSLHNETYKKGYTDEWPIERVYSLD